MHEHHHTHGNREGKLLIILIFTLAILALEVAGGIVSRSLALLSDAGHMLTDALAIFLSYLAVHWSKRPATAQRSYGYHRTEVIVALLNGVTLLFVSLYIFYEAFHRFFEPVEIKTGVLLAVAVVGLAGNLAGMLLLRRESHENMNIRGTFLHLLGDALSSIGVIIGGIIITFTGWNAIDSLISVVIGGIVLRGAVALMIEAGEVLLESTPRDIDLTALREDVEKIPGVGGFHEIHIWTITSGRRALSAHLLTGNISIRESHSIICAVRQVLLEKYNISHATIEAECDVCAGNVCEFHGDIGKEHS